MKAVAAALLLGLGTAVTGGPAAAGPGPVPGPAVADTLPDPDRVVRLLEPGGDRAEGLEALGALARALPPERATLWIRLMAAVERLPPEEGHRAARAVGLAERGRVDEALRLLRRGTPPGDHDAALVGLAAHLADREDPSEGARLRRQLLEAWPEALEAPEARFLLARHLLRGPEGRAEGVELLEAFLVERPDHPLAPEARRLRQAAIRP